MEPPCPPHWTFAARAAYFGDRMCPFCDHRNPADAKFCNECASPLHLKPCSQCNRVNEQAATRCCECGTAFPSLPSTADATRMSPSVDLASARATSGDAADTATITHPPFAAPVMRAYRDLRRPGLLVASVATILIAGAYATHYDAHAPDATKGSSEVVSADEPEAPSATATVAAAPERGPMEAGTAAAGEAPTSAVEPDAQARASVRQDPAPVPAAKRASAHQHPAPQRGTAVSAARRKAHRPVTPTARVPVAEISRRAGPERWQAMYTSLARCSGDVSARIVCDERVRRQFCEGHWNNAPACANGVLTDRGQ